MGDVGIIKVVSELSNRLTLVHVSQNPLHATLLAAAGVSSGHRKLNGSEIEMFSEERKTVSTENIGKRNLCNQSLKSKNLLESKLPKVNSSKSILEGESGQCDILR